MNEKVISGLLLLSTEKAYVRHCLASFLNVVQSKDLTPNCFPSKNPHFWRNPSIPNHLRRDATCGEPVGFDSYGEVFVACHECNFPICKSCFDYEIKEGRKVCLHCSTPRFGTSLAIKRMNSLL